jgi:hypothetical protein
MILTVFSSGSSQIVRRFFPFTFMEVLLWFWVQGSGFRGSRFIGSKVQRFSVPGSGVLPVAGLR